MTCDGRRIQAVIFDLDDTLLDWSGRSQTWEAFQLHHAGLLHDYLESQGYELPEPRELAESIGKFSQEVWSEARQDWLGASFLESLRRTFDAFGLVEVDMNAALEAYDWQPMPGVELFAETYSVLDRLQEQGYRLGLITNSFLPMHVRDVELAHYGLLDYFPDRITSGDTGFMKPHPAIYWRLLGMMRLMPSEAIYVGDRPENDILGANLVGMTSVWRQVREFGSDLAQATPDYTIDDLSQVITILEELG
jgi:putative hydrolase of the HAD superfamily